MSVGERTARSAAALTRAVAGDRPVWPALGASGLVAALYESGGRVDPERLGRLLAAVDTVHPIGVTLGVCVQVAAALPLLRSTLPDHPLTAEATAGRAVLALAATDSGRGSRLSSLATGYRIDGDRLTLTGSKRWITNARTADAFLVLARHEEGPHFTNFSFVLVPAGAPGVTVTPTRTGLFGGAELGDVTFSDVQLPATAVIGGRGRGMALFARHIGTERLAGGLWAVALCRRVLVDTVERLRRPDDGGTCLWQDPGVRRQVAACLARVHELRAVCVTAGPWVVERHDPAAAARVKIATADTVDRVLGECARLHGAAGFVDGGIQRLRTEAAVFGIGGGVGEVALELVADRVDDLLHGLAW
ncbi:acyl-CoA dehydrogenase [Micromonospora sp. WMMD1120]|uniref:acyl-CoA dehydrogenase family protein n=1 Tax=Micromonospora sp. WMMD1120 TaxID=3016106 RepID=UPI002416649F|nr:acyl-CoA dehydrogenase [Micromonospora sp. WMMD1120]MDG4809360.1 acyl-CoA dehydrogenase [Micromonospora sp. WMMD1120]